MKQHLYATVLLAANAVIAPGTQSAALASEGTLAKIERAGQVTMGYRADSSPLSFQDQDGNPAGYTVDICRKIAAEIDAHFPDKQIAARFVRLSSDERISAVVSGDIDMECGSTTITLSRQKLVDFSLPTFVTGGSILSLNPTGIRTIMDLENRKIGVIRNTTTVEQLRDYLAENSVEARIVLVADRNEGMEKLNSGEIAALASDQIVLIGQVIRSPAPENYSLSGEIFSYEPYGVVVPRNDADFRLVVNTAIARLYRSGEQADIFYEWIGSLGISVPPVVATMYQLNALPE